MCQDVSVKVCVSSPAFDDGVEEIPSTPKGYYDEFNFTLEIVKDCEESGCSADDSLQDAQGDMFLHEPMRFDGINAKYLVDEKKKTKKKVMKTGAGIQCELMKGKPYERVQR